VTDPGAGFRFHLEAKLKSPLTIRNNEVCLRRWLRWCDKNGIDYHKVDKRTVAGFMGEISRALMPSTVMHQLFGLRNFYDYLVAEGEVTSNPAREIPYKRPEVREVEPYSETDLKRMIGACESFQERAIIMLLIASGLRRDEIHGITKADCNFTAGTILVRGKGSRYRIVAPGPTVMVQLQLALEFTDRLVPNSAQYVYLIVKNVAARAGIKGRVFPHRHRHTFATSYLDAGGSVEELMTILGHKNVSMSLHYARAGQRRRAVETQKRLDLAGRLLAMPSAEPVQEAGS
jgi:integrase/recombinase XerD